MKHLGDITKIDWANIEPADCITGGSPCQDLSVAGKRAGLAGNRSGLYMEQIRCVKELRDKDENAGRTDKHIRPRFMVWENVPGAFSSNKGKDFAAVLEEAISVAEPQAPAVPVPKEGWHYAGTIVGDGWSIAWRTHDAQYWGVPQRRRRIALVCDFGGSTAPEILFERKSLRGDITPSGTQRQNTTGNFKYRSQTADSAGCGQQTYCLQGNCIDRADTAGCNGKGWTEDVSYTLNTIDRPAVYSIDRAAFNQGKNALYNPEIRDDNIASTLVSKGPSAVYDARGNGSGDIAPTLTGDHQNRITDYTAICVGNGQSNQTPGENTGALNCMHDQQAVLASSNLRRLTPLECERLQGFPDGWTDIGDWMDSKGKTRKTADAQRYKALGNSIAIPFWHWLLARISAQYIYTPTLGSLFDGIGGFPLCWERINGKGTALWASEIEEFPIAVTKRRFSDAAKD